MFYELDDYIYLTAVGSYSSIISSASNCIMFLMGRTKVTEEKHVQVVGVYQIQLFIFKGILGDLGRSSRQSV